MSYEIEENLDKFAHNTRLTSAVETAQQLIGLWPLTQAMHMDNDAKYAENLQVRITRAMAKALTGQQVTMPDAEFVYEGADEIPGRPQSIVDCLLACNDAYDILADVSDTGDAQLIADAAGVLEPWWQIGQSTLQQLANIVTTARDFALTHANDEGMSALSVEQRTALLVMSFAQFAACLSAQGATHTIGEGADGDAASLAFAVILSNELADCLAVPRVTVGNENMEKVVDFARALAKDNFSGVLDESAALYEGVFGIVEADFTSEWQRHYDDVLWDPEEAKKRAKEEDERKNKEALAAKFAHIKDDPTKEEVEL